MRQGGFRPQLRQWVAFTGLREPVIRHKCNITYIALSGHNWARTCLCCLVHVAATIISAAIACDPLFARQGVRKLVVITQFFSRRDGSL